MTDQSSKKVCAVVVCYFPNHRELTDLILAIANQVDKVVIVDNDSRSEAWYAEILKSLEPSKAAKTQLLLLNSNFGVGSAQNRGIEVGISVGSDFFLLFDQDSLPSSNLVRTQLEVFSELSRAGVKVGSVGPCFLDERQKNPPPFISVQRLSLKRHERMGDEKFVEVDYLIASGLLISAAAINECGAMDEGLFIDYVDIEWGLRARTFGFRHFGSWESEMRHSLGEEPIMFRGRAIPVHSPLRHYYLFRNAIHLYFKTSISMNWKLVDLSRLILKFGFYSLFAKPRLKHLGYMLHGIFDGLRGIQGQRLFQSR